MLRKCFLIAALAAALVSPSAASTIHNGVQGGGWHGGYWYGGAARGGWRGPAWTGAWHGPAWHSRAWAYGARPCWQWTAIGVWVWVC